MMAIEKDMDQREGPSIPLCEEVRTFDMHTGIRLLIGALIYIFAREGKPGPLIGSPGGTRGSTE